MMRLLFPLMMLVLATLTTTHVSAQGSFHYEEEEEYDDDYVIDEEAENKFRAQKLHDNAMKLAIDGRELEALPMFAQAAQLDPENSGFWSDLGVTQMRTNNLDAALQSFQVADEILPGQKLIQDNLDALQEHFDWREKQESVAAEGVSNEGGTESLGKEL